MPIVYKALSFCSDCSISVPDTLAISDHIVQKCLLFSYTVTLILVLFHFWILFFGFDCRYLSWDDYFMAIAFLSAERSKDPNRQVIFSALFWDLC